jgi:hypothetical protein
MFHCHIFTVYLPWNFTQGDRLTLISMQSGGPRAQISGRLKLRVKPWAQISGRKAPGLTRGLSPFYITKGGGEPRVKPGFGVLRCRPWTQYLKVKSGLTLSQVTCVVDPPLQYSEYRLGVGQGLSWGPLGPCWEFVLRCGLRFAHGFDWWIFADPKIFCDGSQMHHTLQKILARFRESLKLIKEKIVIN